MKAGSKKLGVIFSYLTVICNMISNLLLVPFYLRILGVDVYGFYQYVYSLAQYAMILDFGIVTIVTKYLSIYRINGTSKDEENFLGHVRIIVAFSIMIIVVIGFVCYTNIHGLIINRTESELALGKIMLCLMVGRIIVAIIQHYYDGILLAYEKYVAAKGMNVARIVIKILVIFLLVSTSKNVLGIVVGDICASVACLLWSIWIAKRRIQYKAKLHYFDKKLFSEAMILVLALMLQSVVIYANNALDKYIVGSYLDNAAVTIYSMALLIYEVFQDMSTTVNSVFLPQVSQVIASGEKGEKVTDIVIKVGRLQCVLCMAMFGGFVLFGKQFLEIWAHSEVGDAWSMAVILMIGAIVPLCESTCLSVLAVENKRMFRSLVLLAIAICNIILSIYLLGKIGLVGVALGTMISILVGNTIVMNIYYKKKMNINIGRVFKEVFLRIGLTALITTAIVFPVRYYLVQTIISFCLEILAFCLIYAVLLYFFALNDSEKQMITATKNKLLHVLKH